MSYSAPSLDGDPQVRSVPLDQSTQHGLNDDYFGHGCVPVHLLPECASLVMQRSVMVGGMVDGGYRDAGDLQGSEGGVYVDELNNNGVAASQSQYPGQDYQYGEDVTMTHAQYMSLLLNSEIQPPYSPGALTREVEDFETPVSGPDPFWLDIGPALQAQAQGITDQR